MRSHPADYELVAPGTLGSVLELLGDTPGEWLPIAGGTEIMVQYGAGKLTVRKLVSIWDLPELRFIEVTPSELRIGAGSTYTDLRNHAVVANEFSLLASGASWTGSIANQNRGTLGGNIRNASPAADSLPALLVYEADLLLVSLRGERRMPYIDFHTGYKQTRLMADELIRAVCLKRNLAGYVGYTRKVGPRNAQAISKVCMAALARTSGDVFEDVRIAVGSMAATPLRLRKTERALIGCELNADSIANARSILKSEVAPIDDIRSTGAYRIAVACNLLEEFVRSIPGQRRAGMTSVLEWWNRLQPNQAAAELMACCGSTAWAREVTARGPYTSAEKLLDAAELAWQGLPPEDWMQAFRSHPCIGERHVERQTTAASAVWSASEQKSVQESDAATRLAIENANRRYEERFGRIFIVCATGKAPEEILANLEERLQNDVQTELQESAKQQAQIMQLRLRKWLLE